MQISKTGLGLITQFEGCRLSAYQDSVGVWTIGYGHTKGVKAGMKITQAQADSYLRDDANDAGADVLRLVKVPLTQNQFDALTSFTFNLGASALKTSTLLTRLNEKNYRAAADQFTRWVFAGGQYLPGLMKRRTTEKELFLS